jgi:hypothetical protein
MLTKLILLNNFKIGELERWKNANVLHAVAKTYLKTLNSQKLNPVIGEYAGIVTMLFVWRRMIVNEIVRVNVGYSSVILPDNPREGLSRSSWNKEPRPQDGVFRCDLNKIILGVIIGDPNIMHTFSSSIS